MRHMPLTADQRTKIKAIAHAYRAEVHAIARKHEKKIVEIVTKIDERKAETIKRRIASS